MIPLQRIACASLPLLLAACSAFAPPAQVDASLPAQWYAPLPHQGTLTDLKTWWKSQGDALLAELIEAAQSASPSIAQAKAHIEQARAVRAAAGGALLPSLDLTASATRSSGTPPLIPTNTTVQRGLQMSWEIDVFGAGRERWRGARARYEGARAGWHEARVTVAAETANQYYGLRACEKLLDIAKLEAESRASTARMVELSSKAGFTAPASAALAQAGAAEGKARASQQQAQCDIELKALVALTGMPEPELRQKLAAQAYELPQGAPIAIDKLPAKLLTQRPDVFAAEMEVAAASSDVGEAQDQRFPRLALSGFIGRNSFTMAGSTLSGDSWAIGPLTVTLPIFDGGRRAANADAAAARYEQAVAQYRATARQAVREVEQALVTLHSAGERSESLRKAVEGYRAAFTATEAKHGSGLASLIELEDARRTRLAAEVGWVSMQRERLAAWIALYRAAGGGWSREELNEAQK